MLASLFSSGVLALGFLTGADVAWLSEVTRTPKEVPHDFAGHMEPLLIDTDGVPIRTLDAWKKRREALETQWQKFLGPMKPAPKTGFTVIKRELVSGCERQRIRYACEDGLIVEAYLLVPVIRTKKTLPGIVALHQTTKATIEEIAGVSGPGQQHIGLKLAQKGFVVICPRNFLWEQTPSYLAAVETFRKRHPGALGMRKMLYDAQRAVDILVTVPQVDPNRIGAIGHSLGAKETLYLTAFDQRIKAAVASEGGTTFRSTNWNAPWYLGKQIDEPGFKRNHHELLALIAPRPFLILAGESGRGAADGDRSWPLVAAAQPIYLLYDVPIRAGILNHRQGHSVPDDVFERAAEWLRVYLAPSAGR